MRIRTLHRQAPLPPGTMMLVADSDAALAARLRQGDLDALDPIFRRHVGALLRLAHHLTASRSDAEDIVQEVFVGLPRAIRHYEERGSFAAWLRAVTARTALACQRRELRRQEEPLVPAHRPAPDGDAGERLALADAILRLPRALRAVFVLKVIEGYSHAEIAALLGVRANTSEVRLFRAIRLLRAALTGGPE